MKLTPLAISDVLLIEPDVFDDERGFFFESFNRRRFCEAIGREVHFVQDNHSQSSRGVLRGLHYQLPPHAQGKLVRVIQGEVLDVAVDIRKGSPTFGRWTSHVLSAGSKQQIWIPEGFAHGFLTLSDTAEFLYKATAYYDPQSERCIRWDDPALGIDWRISAPPLLSDKDRSAAPFTAAEVYHG